MKCKFLWTIILPIIIVWSCNKKKLDQRPIGQLDEAAIANKAGVQGLLIGAYSLLDGYGRDERGVELGGWGAAASNWIYGSVCGSEAYIGSDPKDQHEMRNIERFMPVATNIYLLQKWSAVYAGAYRANTVLRIMRKAKDMSSADTTAARAEALFLRAFYHFEAVKIWKNVPFVDESITYEAGNYFMSNDSPIWRHIENDFKFAIENLPAVQSAAVGRANKYAAQAFLAKIYLFQRKFKEAQPLLQELIIKGTTAKGLKYSLGSYSDNFNPATKNSAEAVFSAQMSVNDNAQGFNGNFGDALNFPNNGGPSGCCGFFPASQWLVNHFKTDPTTGLPDLDNFNLVELKNDMGVESGMAFTPYGGTVDSRLDWTVGRREIPYLDWGVHPGEKWARFQNYSGPYTPKKNVFYKSQQGVLTDGWASLTANNVNLIRYADVLLWAAEAEAEAGNPETARSYVNQVRSRAADASGWVFTYNDASDPTKGFSKTPAANYKVGLYPGPWTSKEFAIKAIQYERILELAMEGHRFFDLVRWGIAETEINTYLAKEKTFRSHLNSVMFLATNQFFPIPQSEIDKSAGPDGVRRLKQNPGY